MDGCKDKAFWELCRHGDIDLVQKAIEDGVDVNEEADEGFYKGKTGLMLAIGFKHNNLVKLLLEHPDIEVNKVNKSDRCCALYMAVEAHNDQGLAQLLARQDLRSINQENSLGWTPIMLAVRWNSVNCFKLLLADQRTSLETRDNFGSQRSPEEVQRWLFRVLVSPFAMENIKSPGKYSLFRFVAAQLEQTFDTIKELLMDKTNQFSVFAGQVSAPELVRL